MATMEKMGNLMAEIKKEQSNLKRKKLKIRARCTHRSEKGNNKLVPKGEQFVCEKCGQVIDFNQLNAENFGELFGDAIGTITNVLEVLKFRANPKHDGKTIELLGGMIVACKELPETFEAAMSKSVKNHERNEKKRRRKGRFGAGLFMGGESLKLKRK